MKISWIILTQNRADIVDECLHHNIDTAGHPYDELIWVDNGSTDNTREVVSRYQPTVQCLFNENKGVARGYNAGLMLARGDWVLLMDSDMKMPQDWLKTYVDYAKAIPGTGCISSYALSIDKVQDRVRGPLQIAYGKPIIPAMPMGRVFFRRMLLGESGFCEEEFGFYGFEHVAWGMSLERTCKKRGLLYYTIPDFMSTHCGGETKEEREWKNKQLSEPKKAKLYESLWLAGWPARFPWGGNNA